MKITLRHFFALRLKALREQKGMTQEALADEAEFSLNYVQALECERRSPSFETIERLAAALKVNPRAFFTDATTKTAASAS